MVAQAVEALSEPEKAIWRRARAPSTARACSLILAALLTALLAERLIELAVESTADSATELAADFAHVQPLDYLSD
jgi:hypothetical protein